jgi:hypothetical protein
VLITALLATLQGWSLPAARPCTPAEVAELTASAAPDALPYRLLCRATLGPSDQIRRRILIEGAEASGAGIDCGGGVIGRPGLRTTTTAPTIGVWSRRIPGEPAHWSRPTDVVIRRCVIHGNVRIWGMGAGGAIDDLRRSSRTVGHTARAQAAAPSHVWIEDVTFHATGSIPLYVGPGVTATQVIRARFVGRSDATAVYLDAESARTGITDSDFDIVTGREQIAVDGSAGNRIAGNRLALRGRGGVFLYRNCGEDGVIRHQPPVNNTITDNVFSGPARFRPRLVVVGAREGRRSYCDDDAGWPFGSSIDDGDNADGNVVARNIIRR